MFYPGRIIKHGEADGSIVQAIGDALQKQGVPVTSPPGVFDAGLRASVRLFQSLRNDLLGRPLTVDGEVGPMTWGALFGAAALPGSSGPGGALASRALAVAVAEIGTMEEPRGSNQGPRVNQYLASTGTPAGNFWCMAFVHWCFQQAASELGVANPFPKTAGVLNAWQRSPGMRVTKSQVLADLGLVTPGAVFIMDYGDGSGHTGFVEQQVAGSLMTVEGNTDAAASGNGIGVFRLTRRSVSNSKMKGFILVP